MATKKKVELKSFDVAEHLRTPEEMAAYLDACIEEATAIPRSSPRRSATSRALRV